MRRAIAALEELGAEPVDVSIPSLKYHSAMRFAFMADSLVHPRAVPQVPTERDYGPTVLYRTLGGQFVLGTHYAKALKVQRLLKEEHARALQQVDFIVAPTMPNPAHRIDQETLRIPRRRAARQGSGLGHRVPVHPAQQRHRAPGYQRALRLQRRRPAHRAAAHRAPLRRGHPVQGRPHLRGRVPRPRTPASDRRRGVGEHVGPPYGHG